MTNRVLIRLLAYQAESWIIHWLLRSEQGQIDYVTGGLIRTEHGVIGVARALGLSSREVARFLKKMSEVKS
jgi:hypothetical protein